MPTQLILNKSYTAPHHGGGPDMKHLYVHNIMNNNYLHKNISTTKHIAGVLTELPNIQGENYTTL